MGSWIFFKAPTPTCGCANVRDQAECSDTYLEARSIRQFHSIRVKPMLSEGGIGYDRLTASSTPAIEKAKKINDSEFTMF